MGSCFHSRRALSEKERALLEFIRLLSLLLWLRDESNLQEHVEAVRHAPMFDDLSVFKATDIYDGHRKLLSRRCTSHEFLAVCAATRQSKADLVLVRNHVFDS